MKRGSRVSEAVPVQVYLVRDERARLERLAESLDTTKADVLRRGLLALEREVTDPAEHPLLKLGGIAEDRGPDLSYDPAVEHGRALADALLPRWGLVGKAAGSGAPQPRAKGRRGRGA